MDPAEPKYKIDDVDDSANVTLAAGDLKIFLSILNVGASRGLFKPEEFSLIGKVNDKVRQALISTLENK
jgi:hypothetical protein